MFGFFKKLLSPLSKKIRSLFAGPQNTELFERLEQIFYEADLGAALSLELVNKVRALYQKNPTLSPDDLLAFVKTELLQTFPPQQPTPVTFPHIILIVGVNGSGKTTTLAKLASYYTRQKKKVLIVAGDTFRAAAIEQLETWAHKIGVEILKATPNSDPSGIVFDALAAAKARHIDITLIDTAGRLHNKTDLMQELAKMRKVCQKQIPDAPNETLLILDATVGQNALDQALSFHTFTPITGIVLTKLDGSAKGGIALAIQRQLGIPIRWIGTGEGAEDLAPFDAQEYIDALI